MSFGEHLEELRGVLIRSLLALAVGVAIGFMPPVGKFVVRSVQAPLRAGLKEFRTNQIEAEYREYVETNPGADEAELAGLAERLERGLVPKVHWVDAAAFSETLSRLGFQPPAEVPAATEDGLMPVTLFTSIDNDPRTRAMGTGVQDAFMVYVKAALLIGVVLSSPVVFYYLWSFVASGLYKEERKYVYVFAPFSLGLFLLGAAVAFFLALGFVLDTLFWFYGFLDIDPTPRIGEWLNFALLLPVGFGAGFQLPLVMLFLQRIGVFTTEQYVKSWKMGVLVITIAAMVLTPQDWQSMVLLGLPMIVLYFVGIGLCRYLPSRETPTGAAA